MRLFVLNINDINQNDEDNIKQNYPLRFERSKKYIKHDDYLLSIGVYVLLEQAFGRFSEDDLYYGEHGKPYLKNKEYFSYAHTGELVVLVVDSEEVGIDAELIDEKKNINRLKNVLTDKEKFYVEMRNSVGRFFRTWVKKESYLKFTGEGLSRKLNEIETTEFNNDYEVNGIYNNVFFLDNYIVSIVAKHKINI